MSDLKSGEGNSGLFQNRKCVQALLLCQALWLSSSTSSLVVCFTFRSMRLFWVSFCEGCKVWVYVPLLLLHGCPVVLCWKDSSFFCHVIAFAHLSNTIFACVYFWAFYSLSLIYVSYCWGAISVELLDNQSQQTKAKLSEPQLIRWLDSHKEVGQFLQFCFIVAVAWAQMIPRPSEMFIQASVVLNGMKDK